MSGSITYFLPFRDLVALMSHWQKVWTQHCKVECSYWSFICLKNEGNKGKNKANRNFHVGFGRQLQEAQHILDDNDDTQIESSSYCGQGYPAENGPDLSYLAGLGIRKSHGCQEDIVCSMYPPPKGFAFHMKALKIWKDQITHEWWQLCGNVYFHFNMTCIQKHTSWYDYSRHYNKTQQFCTYMT